MADEFPVCDVLCDAMEYLTKLGSNLRSRSESLKEKKIRKDKLKNSHAVQKAAQKVLLICELSKKSLENVETGVKKVLSHVNAGQRSIDEDGKQIIDKLVSSKHRKSTESASEGTSKSVLEKKKDLSSPKKIHVSGKSYCLRFPRKINVKHYMSIKVLARSMPKTMLEKYPVYYNCKLYQDRQKALVRRSRESIGAKQIKESDEKPTKALNNTINNSLKTDQNARNLPGDKRSSDEDKILINKNQEQTTNKTVFESNEPQIISELGNELEHTKENENNQNLKLNDSESVKHSERLSSSDSKSGASLKSKEKKDPTLKERKISKEKRGNKNNMQLESHDASPKTTKKNSKEFQNKESKKENADSCLNDHKKNSKKFKKIQIFDDSSDSEKDFVVKNEEEKCSKSLKDIPEVDDTFGIEKDITKKSYEGVINLDVSNNDQNEPVEDKTKENVPQNDLDIESKQEDKKDLNTDNLNAPTKPLIKCVSISKLLKPDVLDKQDQHDENSSNVKTQNSKLFVHMTRKGEIKAKYIATTVETESKNNDHDTIKTELKSEKIKKKVRYQDEEQFWERKRQEVEMFKSKNFVINVTRLPKFDETFLNKNNLKIITHFGVVLYDISTAVNNLDSEKTLLTSGDDNNSPKEKSLPSTSEAKNALLNDSDTENLNATPTLLANESENIKNSLLNNSDTDGNVDQETNEMSTNKKRIAEETQTVKNLLLDDSDSDKKDHETIGSSEVHAQSIVEEVPSQNKETHCQQTDEQDKALAKSSLLNESSDSSSKSQSRKRKESKLNGKSIVEKIPSEKKETYFQQTDEQDKALAKSSLLNESSDSSSKSQSRKRKRKESMAKSPRKHIMESMHAKKMLLTYSSSSDTEDEQLKSVIKDIKEELMKSIEEKEEATKCLKKKVQSSSDSDEDILGRLNKKKKTVDDSLHKKSQIEKASQDETETQENKADASGTESRSSEKSKSSFAKMGRSREKPGGSSSQNSDSHEDRDIEGLTNLKGLTKSRHRRDSASDRSASKTSTPRARRMAKASQIFDENLLAPESSDDASGGDSDGPEEDLPPVSMSALNGGPIEHLAKDDLLEESGSDTSKDKSSDAKKDDDSDSEAVRAKRRKAQAISSDSEAGSSRRKQDPNVRISDFEDSEDENSEPLKRSKRKKKGSDSDASVGSSTEGKKKRKRIKQIDSDDVSGSDTENEGRNKHGRKNIRKVMGKNQLEEATKKAAREEKERLARIAERQKMYNNLEFDESGKPDEVIVDKVVLDFDPETKEPLIEIDRGLVKKLKPHQANGIKFMWDACFESVKRIKKDRGSGCILAHCMGLGKTLQVVSLTHTLLTHSELTGVNRVLVVCPLSTVLNWVNEFRMWLKHALTDYEVDIYELSKYKQNSERAFQLSQWLCHGGVCVLGYEMFRNLSADNPKKFKKKMLRQFQESLVDPGPDMVVCDEGHLLKNEKTSLSQSMNRVRTRRRIVLTGTPLQNNLKEYYCMVQFVKPNLLGKYNEYLNRFVNPITNGQYTDSTEHDIKIMKRRSHVLHKMLDGAVQRRDYGVLAPFLPPKHEYVLFITLTDVQVKLYQHYLDNYSRRPLAGKSSGFLFPDFQSLQRIWTHPLVLKYNSERYEIMQQKKREREEEDSEGSLVDFIDDDSTPDESSTEESTDDLSDVSDDSRKKSKKKKKDKKSKTKDNKLSTRRGTRANPVELDDGEEQPDPDIIEVKNDNPTEWWIPLVTDDEIEDMRNSHKLVLLFEILRQCEAIGDKLLVFSQSLYSLDLIEHFLGKVDEATQEGRIDEKLGRHVGSWSPGVDYFRLDGSTSCENRSIWCKNFNREDNPRARLFLISTRAGGLGINLVAANRVVIFDVSWNPSHDVQSIFRVYRFGQKKPCYIYRFLAMGTMEEKIYERQVTKQAISKRVIDEQQIDRHYAENDLAELYKFEPRPPAPRPVPLVPKDRLFAEMLKEHEHVIYKFHEHDSLLENKEEETLSEEERKAAWEDFENEKNRPPPQPFTAWPMHNGMPNMNLMAQQQQQLAYAALAGMLRKDMPNLSDENIRAMLPLLYSSNPGLMQKLSEMYKYAQPGMMNPQMMNMNMNPGGVGAVGGSSGLQYEPPWQRQQQQQQQMRLQQLLQQQKQFAQQQQQPMGAKLYAGGLGSRDPVAMALQQQRAREIMLGGGGAGGVVGAGGGAVGRPRGRPTLQAHAPPPPSDIVNLDSD